MPGDDSQQNKPVTWGAFRYEMRLLRQQGALALCAVLVGNEALETVAVPDEVSFPALGLILLKFFAALR